MHVSRDSHYSCPRFTLWLYPNWNSAVLSAGHLQGQKKVKSHLIYLEAVSFPLLLLERKIIVAVSGPKATHFLKLWIL